MNKKQLVDWIERVVEAIVLTANNHAEDNEQPITKEEGRALLGRAFRKIEPTIVAHALGIDDPELQEMITWPEI